MQIAPRYEGPPPLTVEGLDVDPSAPVLRQRRRLGELLGTFDDAQWAAPSRCDGWSVRDVVAHLNTTNRYWAISIAQGRAGTPTRFLEGFDPVATPAQLVASAAATSTGEVLAEYLASTEAMAEVLTELADDEWDLVAECPPGHVAIRAVCLHALWDAWIHERDILLPLGRQQETEPDEVQGALVYAAGLGPAFLAMAGNRREGTLVVHPDDAATVVVEVGPTVRASTGTGGIVLDDDALLLEGSAVDLVEKLSYRAPHDPPIPPHHAWMLSGLGEVFDQA